VQNSRLEARNHFSLGNVPLRWNEFGGTIGGPIRRDKAFFFFSYQGLPQVTDTPTYANMPTAAMRSGNFTDPVFPTIYDPATLQQVNGNWVEQPFSGNSILSNRFDPVASAILPYFPQPNLSGSVLNYYYISKVPENQPYINGKIDYNVSSSNHITASAMVSPIWYAVPAAVCAIDCSTLHADEFTAQLTDMWTFNPHLAGEFRFSVVHADVFENPLTAGQGYPAKLGLKNPAADVFPSISISGVSSSAVGASLPSLLDAEAAFVPAGTVTLIEGKHILKFGGEFDRWQYNGQGPLVDEGNFTFSGTFTRNPSNSKSTGLGWADFLLGLPVTWAVSYAPSTGGRMWSGAAFAQDEYKIRKNLTLTLGLRYSMQSGWSEVYNRVANFDPTLLNPGSNSLGALWYAGQQGRNALQDTIWDFFDPRAGFAWEPRRNWSVRGGYGLYDLPWGAYAYYRNTGTGWATSGYETSTDLIHPIFSLSAGPPLPTYPTAALRTPNLVNGQGVTYFPQNTPMAYSEQYRFDVEHVMKGGVLVDAAYVGNHDLHLPYARDMNQVPEALLGPGNAQLNRPYPQYAAITAYLNRDISNYTGFQLSFRKDFAHGLLFLANYTWAKAMDTMTVNAYHKAPATWQDAYDFRADYGPASTDIRHMLSGNFVYELPVGQGKRFINHGGHLLNGVLGGWRLSSMFQLDTGIPFTPTVGTANLSGALSGSWRPNRIGSGTVSHPTIAEWFNPSAFQDPTPYTYGDSGRNILYGPSWRDMDLSLAKAFKIGERFRFQLRADAFDVFDVSNFGLPDAGIGDGSTGIIKTANTARNVQLGAKLEF
jgi:hypothetical protein